MLIHSRSFSISVRGKTAQEPKVGDIWKPSGRQETGVSLAVARVTKDAQGTQTMEAIVYCFVGPEQIETRDNPSSPPTSNSKPPSKVVVQELLNEPSKLRFIIPWDEVERAFIHDKTGKKLSSEDLAKALSKPRHLFINFWGKSGVPETFYASAYRDDMIWVGFPSDCKKVMVGEKFR